MDIAVTRTGKLVVSSVDEGKRESSMPESSIMLSLRDDVIYNFNYVDYPGGISSGNRAFIYGKIEISQVILA